MLSFDVFPVELSAASLRQMAVSTGLGQIGAQIESVAASAAGAACGPAAPAAISEWGASWAYAVGRVGDSVGGFAANLGAAGPAYEATEAGLMRSGSG